jgi:hypothetical protein
MGLSFLPAALCAAAVLWMPAPATAQTAAAVALEEIGFFGNWAIQCGQPAGPRNILRSAYVAANGEPGFAETVAPDVPANTYRVLSATRDGTNQIVLDVELNDDARQRLRMVFDGKRIRTLTNEMPDGKVLVEHGAIVATGTRTPWLTRCDAPAGSPG